MFPRFHEAPFVPGEYTLHMIEKDGRHGIKQHIVYRKDERLPTPSFLPSPRSVGRSVGQSLVWVPMDVRSGDSAGVDGVAIGP
jgi:hypothetical protein